MARKKSKSTGKGSRSLFISILTYLKRASLWFLALSMLWVLIYRFINPPFTSLMIQRGIERKFDGKSWKVDKTWRDYDELSTNLKKAAIAGEDAGFVHHWGFDADAIQKAYLKNRAGKPIRGGSTISQQTAKNVFLWGGRSWLRKGFEVWFTVLIEVFWSKQRILEVYLNVIEMGDGIYGAEAATQEYYSKSAESMSKRQAALLVAVFPNPRKWTPAHPTNYIYYKRGVIMRNMRYIRLPD
ncbi:Monofunctional biosynthetic peptidoglycan transglycosylase [Arcticibacter svalbardensis MN12-7]|uniref:Biosynthetic peptidoglycan transglycosylase n=1 Tax=Arcticibacter svalbardensis MN12-7 TaxID=1150600 RepID=R9GXV6_9SPHI|nr:monofunctional biosynthetic peptidoglycan transglycosylase [Arcticibacter svalbardensis]EOR96503.1 Monofunctional biosynthetic peptidoglycan transglycosylase [Arcticibacter svalbardensis MN12-7]